jgi:hypothetical protein
VTPEQLYHFDLRGYVVLPGVLSTGEVDALRDAIAQLKAPPPGEDIWSQRISDLLHRHPLLLAMLDHPNALDVVFHTIGKRARIDHTYAIRMATGSRGLGPHGGGSPFDPGQFYDWRDGRMRNGLTVLAWSLVDAPPGMGGFGCIPGSHKANLPYPGGGASALVEQVPMQAGDLLVFTEALTHCTIDWTAPHERLLLLYKYSPGNSAWAPSTELDNVRSRPDLTDNQRRFLQPPNTGYFEPLER